jgi:hypothetical protein
VYRILRKLRQKVDDMSPSERRFAATAAVCAPFVEVSLRTAGLARTLAWIEVLTDHRPRSPEAMDPERAASIVDSVYRLQPLRGRCLPRALLQYGLQRRAGEDVRFVVGVRKPEEGALDAHAWVEVVGGARRSVDFEPILRAGAS